MKTETPIPMEALSLEKALALLGLTLHYSPRARLIWRGLADLYGEDVFNRPLGLSGPDTFDQLLDRPIMAPRQDR